MKELSNASLVRAKKIILGRDPEFKWRTEKMKSLSIVDATVFGGAPLGLSASKNDAICHTLVVRIRPHDKARFDLDRAIAKLIFGYAEQNRIPRGTFSCGGGTCADGELWESYSISDSFLGGLRESLAGHKRTV